MTSADPRRSPKAAVRNFTDELNATLRYTVTEHPLVPQITTENWAHIAFTDDKPVKLDETHWIHITFDLYIGDFDSERTQYRSHVVKAIFTYLDSPDLRSGPVIEYHFHKMELTGARPALVPHLHVRTIDGRRSHIFVGRCCMEDLLEYLIREEGVGLMPYSHPSGQAMTAEELLTRASSRLHESREKFHEQFKTKHAITPLDDLPHVAQEILSQLR